MWGHTKGAGEVPTTHHPRPVLVARHSEDRRWPLGEFLWWQEQVSEVIEQTCDGMLTVAYVLGDGTGAGQSITYTRTDAVVRFTFYDAPIRVDSVVKTGPMTLSVDDGELVMIR